MPSSEDFLCPDFSPVRRRRRRTELAPPLAGIPAWSFDEVGYLPRLRGDRAWVSFTRGELAALDRATAERLWTHSLSGSYVSFADDTGTFLVDGEHLFLSDADALFILDAGSGEVVRRVELPGALLQDALVLEGVLICPTFDEDESLTAYHIGDDTVLWQLPLARRSGPLTGIGGRVVFAERHAWRAIDAATGRSPWSHDVLEEARWVDEFGEQQPGEAVGRAIALEDRLAVGLSGSRLACLDAATGEALWVRQVGKCDPAMLTHYPAADGPGTLYSLGFDSLHAVDAESGEELASFELAEEKRRHELSGPLVRPAATDTHLYCLDHSRSLLAIALDGGNVEWVERLEGSARAADGPLVVDGRLWVVDGDGHLRVFEPATA